MINQRGGLKRINSAGKLSNTDILLEMIKSEGATLEFLVSPESSLKGIIAVLNVKPEHSAYTGLNPETGKLNLEVSSFIIKFAITTPSGNNRLEYKGIKKESESNKSFLEETILQQDIWFKSILGRKPPIEICPSIGSLLLLNYDDGQKFLSEIPESHVRHLLQGFLSVGRGLGILLMQNVENSETLSSIRKNYEVMDNNVYLSSLCILIAQVVRLFVFLKVIHFDLHTKNALFFYQQGEINPMCKLIDFGSASDVSNPNPDFFLTTQEKKDISAKIEIFSSKFYELSGYLFDQENNKENNEEKIEFISVVMKYLTSLDHNKLYEKFNIPRTPYKYQMNWYENVIHSSHRDNLLLKAFELLREIKIVNVDDGTGLCRSTIKKYMESGKLFDVKTTLSSDLGSTEYIVQSVEPSAAGCSIMGGKKKTKKSRKQKKSKKTKKHKKTKKIRYKYKNKN